MPIEKMNLSPRNMGMIEEMIKRPHGILLVVGPTGSGKTTTLHAVLGYLNTPDKKIWTAEDPVEITQPGLQQVQVVPKIGFTFANALRAFLRADPDIILIGEMRDKETAHAGIEASLTVMTIRHLYVDNMAKQDWMNSELTSIKTLSYTKAKVAKTAVVPATKAEQVCTNY
jgi:type II secretory ATPase GspE/PulE/Tfp pilus assembly ATPase PilB-like protein